MTIGVELLNDPPIVFMDEPTSGLDPFQAQAVMETLRTLADAGRTVVASIHQPLLHLPDARPGLPARQWTHRLLWRGGRRPLHALAGAGHPIPASYNPSDFVIDLISVDSVTRSRQKQVRCVSRRCLTHGRHTRKRGVTWCRRPPPPPPSLPVPLPWWGRRRRCRDGDQRGAALANARPPAHAARVVWPRCGRLQAAHAAMPANSRATGSLSS